MSSHTIKPAATNSCKTNPGEGPFLKYGLTDPISLKYPTPKELLLTKKLHAVLQEKNLFETEEGIKHRQFVLEELSKLLNEWVCEVYEEKVSSQVEAFKKNGLVTQHARIFTFGSYHLGVVTPGGDIDALCVVPHFVLRDAFFEFFLAKLQQDPGITKIQAVPDAYTPIIKLQFHHVDVDLLFARLYLPRVPPDLVSLRDDNLLKNVDEKTVRSLNGCRVAEDLLLMVPDKNSFIMTLRFIRYWAKQRGIYSNVFGYLGGISWAILVGRVCQLYPYATASQEYADKPGLMNFQVWNPKLNAQDWYHLMPIITPSFPSMNSTHNVTLTTREIIVSEFQRGLEQVSQIRKGNATWASVLEPFDFFNSSDHFLEFFISGANGRAYDKWHGWVESKMRFLMKKLEPYPMFTIHPWPYSLPVTMDGENTKSAFFFAVIVDMSFRDARLDLCTPVMEFVHILLFQWPEYHLYKHCVNLSLSHVERSNLPSYVKKYRAQQGFTTPVDGALNNDDAQPPQREDTISQNTKLNLNPNDTRSTTSIRKHTVLSTLSSNDVPDQVFMSSNKTTTPHVSSSAQPVSALPPSTCELDVHRPFSDTVRKKTLTVPLDIFSRNMKRQRLIDKKKNSRSTPQGSPSISLCSNEVKKI